MNPIYLDLHIHTSDDPNHLNNNYDLALLIKKIKEVSQGTDFLISLTDHNTINKAAYLNAVKLGINIVVGVELHIKNYEESPAYHCHIYFDLPSIDDSVLDDLNNHLDKLYPKKIVQKNDKDLPFIQNIINEFDNYEFMLLPHGGQSHATFDTSIPSDVKFDTTLQRSIYYNQFEGFTARGDAKLEKTQEYFARLGINDFVNLITCSDNYDPSVYPNGKDKNPFKPTWMLANPTFNGLRLSLSEQSRLIYSSEAPKLWSENIKSIKLTKPNIDIDVQLTPGLNVIIGDSSSGKTLLVDSIMRSLKKEPINASYATYGVDKIQVDNPSGMVPHFLSQNYIMSVVNDVSDDKIEDIDIIKRVFPGDGDVKEKINEGLRGFKKNIEELVKNARVLELETTNLSKIPVFSRLIVKGSVQANPFEALLPKAAEIDRLKFSEPKYKEFNTSLDEINHFLKQYPFVAFDDSVIKTLKDNLSGAVEAWRKEQKVRSIVTAEKQAFNEILKRKESEEQTKKQNFNKLLESLSTYRKAFENFHRALRSICSYSIKIESEEIQSIGHKLYIQNGFQLNKEKFVETVNSLLTEPISDPDNISSASFFESNFRKKSPKISSYDDFEARVYGNFEKLNKKTYKIVTNDGREFDKLSPGWKTSVILDLILGYDKDISPIIIDQPEDNLAITYINEGLVAAIKNIKAKKQIILVSHNATIPMLADAQNIVLCRNIDKTILIRSSPLEGQIDGKNVVDYIAEITDGGKPAIKKRVKKYNLKKFN